MDVKVKNSEEFMTKIQKCGTINKGQRLATWDYESMYTNIPVNAPLTIIQNDYEMLTNYTRLPSFLFIELLEFTI